MGRGTVMCCDHVLAYSTLEDIARRNVPMSKDCSVGGFPELVQWRLYERHVHIFRSEPNCSLHRYIHAILSQDNNSVFWSRTSGARFALANMEDRKTTSNKRHPH